MAVQRPTLVFDPHIEHWRANAHRLINLLLSLQEPIEKTLTANAASTTIKSRLIGKSSIVLAQPLTDNAWAEYRGSSFKINRADMSQASGTAPGQFVVRHANSAQTDRDFAFAIIG